MNPERIPDVVRGLTVFVMSWVQFSAASHRQKNSRGLETTQPSSLQEDYYILILYDKKSERGNSKQRKGLLTMKKIDADWKLWTWVKFWALQKIFNFKEDFRISIKQEIEIKKNQREVKKEKGWLRMERIKTDFNWLTRRT